MQSTTSFGNTNETKEHGSSRTLDVEHTNRGDIIDEPNVGMCFESDNELMSYYKHYGKRFGFRVMTQRSKKDKDESVKYVTLGYARAGKARN